jgi:hypothetical protein
VGYRRTGRPNGRPRQPLSDRVRRAIEAEAQHAATEQGELTIRQIADASGLTRSAVRKWRIDDRYQAALDTRTQKLMVEQLLQRLEEGDRQREEAKVYSWWSEYARARRREMTEQQRDMHLRWWVADWAHRNWHQRDLVTGPIFHELDPRNFPDPESYAEALIARGYIPTEEPSWGLVPTESR